MSICTDRIVGDGQVGHHGLFQHMLSFIETLCVLNPSRVVGDELVVRNIAELIYGLDILFPLLYTEQLYTLCRKITIFFFFTG